ncbi:hypothetical protein [Streptomyces lydicus]|nr:hypothetical protein [Streptomyces lydicus]
MTDGSIVGMIQWWEDATPITHQAGINILVGVSLDSPEDLFPHAIR